MASVHGYRSLMWVGDARKTLHNTRNRFIAQTFVAELVDDLLEAMLEGWAFGERESNFTVAGFAPTVQIKMTKGKTNNEWCCALAQGINISFSLNFLGLERNKAEL